MDPRVLQTASVRRLERSAARWLVLPGDNCPSDKFKVSSRFREFQSRLGISLRDGLGIFAYVHVDVARFSRRSCPCTTRIFRCELTEDDRRDVDVGERMVFPDAAKSLVRTSLQRIDVRRRRFYDGRSEEYGKRFCKVVCFYEIDNCYDIHVWSAAVLAEYRRPTVRPEAVP